mgnify:CR=1 FL=1
MATFNVKFNIDNIENEADKQAFLDLIEQHRNPKTNKTDSQKVMKDLIETLGKQSIQSSRGGLSETVSQRITNAVQAQMSLNQSSDKFVEVGSGENKEKVFYERRVLTPRGIASLDGFNIKSVTNWLNQGNNADWVNNHNRDVLGIETDILNSPASDEVKRFNLKSARSNRTANP